MASLEHLLAPIEPAVFFREIWERRHHVLERCAPDYYADLLSLDDVDGLIGLGDAAAPLRQGLRLVKRFTDRLEVRPAKDQAITSLRDVHDAYARGFSVVLDGVDRQWRPVAELCRGLETALQCRLSANLYLTPRGAQGFPRHFDTHDVFVLQLAGSKTWKIDSAGTPLPLAPLSAEERPTLADVETASGEECRLTAGDLLYLPRGHIHEARTDTGSSLHLTLGVHVTRWADLLSDAIRLAAEREVSLREAVPPDWLRAGTPPDALGPRFQELLRLVTAGVSAGDVLADRSRRFLAARRPPIEGHFRSLDRLPDLAPDSLVRRRSGLECRSAVENGVATLRFGSNWVEGPERLAAQLAFVAATEAFMIADLPGPLDGAGKVVLVRRLVREGLLSVEPQGAD